MNLTPTPAGRLLRPALVTLTLLVALGRTVAGNPEPAALARWAEHLLVKHALREVKAGRSDYAPTAPVALTPANSPPSSAPPPPPPPA